MSFRLIDPEDVNALMDEYGKRTLPQLMKELHQFRLRQDNLCQLEHRCLCVRENIEELYCRTKVLIEQQLAATPDTVEQDGWRHAYIAAQSLNARLELEAIWAKDELNRLKEKN